MESLPTELVHHILVQLGVSSPASLAAVACTCTRLASIARDPFLLRRIYRIRLAHTAIAPIHAPPEGGRVADTDWRGMIMALDSFLTRRPVEIVISAPSTTVVVVLPLSAAIADAREVVAEALGWPAEEMRLELGGMVLGWGLLHPTASLWRAGVVPDAVVMAKMRLGFGNSRDELATAQLYSVESLPAAMRGFRDGMAPLPWAADDPWRLHMLQAPMAALAPIKFALNFPRKHAVFQFSLAMEVVVELLAAGIESVPWIFTALWSVVSLGDTTYVVDGHGYFVAATGTFASATCSGLTLTTSLG
ncbi:uncharacterized protein AMSG_07871 [Thecamonas trahens ATCC 50062]|uniref:F-box domain-containing protein n=1 Tax=Thecamonas trahens ATCC 50062 TaxID=461836 RepID=A0A0L0DHK4_THETB|nr:hypothetical protein AMSG_07871 [Thecamonas trahens ATCC 50062]KNC51797.1 hypothetical protein AMSG_07871 [Thecamonas trahens ATCC 50062]|eukprot:XP_013755666.1 hypothetical protein AMSG_07871 [Thecamonas trahens ATCC 50062]